MLSHSFASLEMKISAEKIEEYVSGKCMFLAAALHRLFGWGISATLVGPDPDPYIGHAWCVQPGTRYCVDIDGAYSPDLNGWVWPEDRLMCGLNEEELFQFTKAGAGIPFTRAEWEKRVDEALIIAKYYLAPKLSAPAR